MKVNVDIVPYSENNYICLEYVPGADIKLDGQNNDFCISANAEGLLYLAKVCLTLAQSDTPKGCHIHFEGFDFVQGNATDLIIERV